MISAIAFVAGEHFMLLDLQTGDYLPRAQVAAGSDAAKAQEAPETELPQIGLASVERSIGPGRS